LGLWQTISSKHLDEKGWDGIKPTGMGPAGAFLGG